MIANLFISDACVRCSSANKAQRGLAPGTPPDAFPRETGLLLGLFRDHFCRWFGCGSVPALGARLASRDRPIAVSSVIKGQCS